MSAAAEVLAWLAARPRLLEAQPVDLSICGSCRYQPSPRDAMAIPRSTHGPLAVLSSPSGPYALCSMCLGADGVPTPSIRPARGARAH